jgi:hypothetical protein
LTNIDPGRYLRLVGTLGAKAMHRLLQTVIIALLALTGSALADPVRVQDPGKFCQDLFADISPFNSSDIASKVATTIGNPAARETLQNALKILDSKKIDFWKKVIDRDVSGALRQIVYYAYVENLGFLYFRLNFKMTSTGWILANFNFKSESNELFPKDFVDN